MAKEVVKTYGVSRFTWDGESTLTITNIRTKSPEILATDLEDFFKLCDWNRKEEKANPC